jgi:hypothetical protein
MREHANPHVLANTVRILRDSGMRKCFVLLEGGQDISAYRSFFSDAHCHIQPGQGRQHILDAGEILHKAAFPGFVVVVDQDEWAFTERPVVRSFLFCTDGRDLESTLLRNGVGLRIIENYADPKEVQAIEKQTRRPILSLIAEWAAVIGMIRWFSMQRNLGLCTKDIDIFSYVDFKSLMLQVEKVALDIVLGSERRPYGDPAIAARNLAHEAERRLKTSPDHWVFCSGHDLCRTLAGGLATDFGRKMCKPLTSDLLEAAVRTAYSWSDFEATRLAAKIEEWEAANAPYRILARKRSVA